MKITTIVWGSDIPLLIEAAELENVDLVLFATHEIKEKQELFIQSQKEADIILLHPSKDTAWDEIIPQLRQETPIFSFGYDQDFWSLSNVSTKIASIVSNYMLNGGLENYRKMLRFFKSFIIDRNTEPEMPILMPWEGIYHPEKQDPFLELKSYRLWRPRKHKNCVGIIFSRTYWANGDHKTIDALIYQIEKFADVVAIFCLANGDKDLGAKPGADVAKEMFTSDVEIILNLQPVFKTSDNDVFNVLNVPVIHPLILYHDSREKWIQSELGISPLELGWNVALPEMQGMIEMLPVCTEENDKGIGMHQPIEERVNRVINRLHSWLKLKSKDISKRKIVFVLHNKPCSSVEATIGAGAHLDTLESTARIMQILKNKGYTVNPPKDGKELIDTILEKRAISDFRWTSVESIVKSGGALDLIDKNRYLKWFEQLDPEIQNNMIKTWGNPPGEEIDGVTPSMIYENKIVVTGISFGNCLVCVQPKRGCAGARCDAEACKILHDPDISPTHQYFATYKWIEQVFHADLIIHVGTHGSLEFLPGKSAASSNICYPDICIGTIPHLYIYNSDNPPEGTIAKRRACATLVDHMQTVMQASGLYGELKELENLLEEYTRAKSSDPFRKHKLEHLITGSVINVGIIEDTNYKQLEKKEIDFETFVESIHRTLTRISSSRIPNGMHIFGEQPVDEDRMMFIHSVVHFDNGIKNALFGKNDIDTNIADIHKKERDEIAFVREILHGNSYRDAVNKICSREPLPETVELLKEISFMINALNSGIEKSKEIESLLDAMDGKYVSPGPSGLITRGRPDILPTGRNFYSLDPTSVPTKAAWMVGSKLADVLIDTYIKEHGKYPETVAMYWMASDLMWADGEQMAQIMALIGVHPIWKGGKVVSFEVISLEQLGRPRIDITIKVSGILRDCFFCAIELLDKAINAVSKLAENKEMNPIKLHTEQSGTSKRIFSCKPGTYGNGVNLAIYASAWEEEKDLADIFLDWNSYSYGNEDRGTKNIEAFSSLLSHVDITFNKTATDEYDLCGCCCYFGNHGGMTAAARTLSGKDVEAYYGDTRTPSNIEIRTLAAELRRVVTTKLLNPTWIEGMKKHGYKGAGDIAKRIGTVYGWEASTGEVDDRIFNEITKTFMLNKENRSFFERENPYALEEIGRRLLEAQTRGLWIPDSEIAQDLREAYLETEGWLEDKISSTTGEIQGGGINIMNLKDVKEKRHRGK